MTKRFTFLIFTILFCVLGVAQETEKPTGTETNKTEVDETKILLNTPNTVVEETPQTEFSFFGSLWKIIFMLALVCGLAYIVLRLLKKANAMSFNDDPYLKVASSLKLAPNKILYIITLKREAFLIAVTEKTVSLIAKIEDAELIDTLNLNVANKVVEQKSFAEMLSALFTKNASKPTHSVNNEIRQTTNTNVQQDKQTDELTGAFLSEVRDRLNNTETPETNNTWKNRKNQNVNKGDV